MGMETARVGRTLWHSSSTALVFGPVISSSDSCDEASRSILERLAVCKNHWRSGSVDLHSSSIATRANDFRFVSDA